MNNSIVQNDDAGVIPKEQNLANENPKVMLGDYIIKTELGNGGYGRVLQVIHKGNSEIQYALKYYMKETVLKANQMGNLKKELDVMKQLNSPFVTNLIEVFQTPHSLCFLMEACQPVNFHQILEVHRSMDNRRATFFSAQLFLGIKYLHQKNIVHQDIKLENLLITRHGDLKICDFGLSEPNVDPETRLTKYCGTLPYLSPEKVRRIEYTMKTDWWTFGIVVAELFGCLTLFQRGTSQETKSAIVMLKMEWTAKMPEKAQDLVKKLLKYEDQRLSEDEISNHPFFEKVVWKDYEEQRIPPCCTINPHSGNIGLSHSIEPEDSIEMDEEHQEFNIFNYKRLLMK